MNARLKALPNSNEEEIVGIGRYVLDVSVFFSAA